MTTQPRLWGFANTTARQGELFDVDGPPLCGMTCSTCGADMERTGQWIACPAGHGRLIEATADHGEPCGSWFADDLTGGE